eukprot:11182824-Lingulodinium_polyedra.AAC.1
MSAMPEMRSKLFVHGRPRANTGLISYVFVNDRAFSNKFDITSDIATSDEDRELHILSITR